VGGQGAGQWATITAISSDGHTVWVNSSWQVNPTSGSTYATFDWSSANWIIAGNNLSDNEKGIEFFSSSIRDIQVTGNTLTNNGEILVSPTEQPDGAGIFNLVLNTQILNNQLVDNNHLRPAAISAVPREDDENNNFGTSIIGLEVRGNTITGFNPNTLYTDISLDDYKARTEGLNLYWQWQTTWSSFTDNGIPSILGTVIEGNTLNQSVAGIEVNSLTSQTVLAANSFNNAGTVKVDSTVPGASHASIGTVIAGTTAPKIPPVAPPAPNVWNQVTIGSLAASKLASEPESVTSFSLGTSLYQFGGTADSLSMLAQQEGSDITAIARITIPSGSNQAAQGLVTFRDSSSPSGAFVSIGVLQNGYVSFAWRCWDGAGLQGYSFAVPMSPVWVKLIKSGNLFQAYFASDGLSWQYAGEIGLTLSGTSYLVGLESLSNTVTGPPIVFDNVSIP
jgi:parallel beta-helix repeat protein